MIGLVQLHFGGSLLLLVFENFGLGRILTKLIWWLEVTIVKGKLNGAGCYSGQRREGQALSEAEKPVKHLPIISLKLCWLDISNVIMTAVLWRKYLIKSENTWVARQNLSGPSFLQSTLSHLFIHLLLVGSDQHHLLKQSLMDFQSTAFVKTINGWISNCSEFWIAWGKSVSVFGRDCVRLP